MFSLKVVSFGASFTIVLHASINATVPTSHAPSAALKPETVGREFFGIETMMV